MAIANQSQKSHSLHGGAILHPVQYCTICVHIQCSIATHERVQYCICVQPDFRGHHHSSGPLKGWRCVKLFVPHDAFLQFAFESQRIDPLIAILQRQDRKKKVRKKRKEIKTKKTKQKNAYRLTLMRMRDATHKDGKQKATTFRSKILSKKKITVVL